MDVQQPEVNRKGFVDAMEAEDTRGLEVAPRVDVLVLGERSPSHTSSRHAPNRRVIRNLSYQCLDDEPLPHEIR